MEEGMKVKTQEDIMLRMEELMKFSKHNGNKKSDKSYYKLAEELTGILLPYVNDPKEIKGAIEAELHSLRWVLGMELYE